MVKIKRPTASSGRNRSDLFRPQHSTMITNVAESFISRDKPRKEQENYWFLLSAPAPRLIQQGRNGVGPTFIPGVGRQMQKVLHHVGRDRAVGIGEKRPQIHPDDTDAIGHRTNERVDAFIAEANGIRRVAATQEDRMQHDLRPGELRLNTRVAASGQTCCGHKSHIKIPHTTRLHGEKRDSRQTIPFLHNSSR